jgi:hypothetical protein
MTITNAARLFQPLSGKELRKIMLDDFEKMLDESGYFSEHLSFSLADMEIKATITSNPPLFNDIDLEVKRRLETEDAGELPSTPKTVNIRGKRRSVGEVPDADREEHGLATTEVRRDETTGVFFDQPVESVETTSRSATVGGGTRPRGSIPEAKVRKAAQGSADLESGPQDVSELYPNEPLLDDGGQEVKVNR